MSGDLTSGKGHTDENFPVASFLVAKRHRPPIMAFYAVARMADDIADHADASPEEKLGRLAAIETSLTGRDDAISVAVRLHETMAERGLSDRHILDLLEAFRRDARKARYADWDDLMDYCRFSAAPVGRFVLDVHGESDTTWPASDALCAALQVINHLQDCGEDYRRLDRVYLPTDTLAAAGVEVAELDGTRATPALKAVISRLAERTLGLLEVAQPLGRQVRDARLALEIGVIHRLAVSLARRLTRRDPLSERVHHWPIEALCVALAGAGETLARRAI